MAEMQSDVVQLDLRTKRMVAGAITDFCGHTGEPDEGDAFDVWCPACRSVVNAVFRALGQCSTPAASAHTNGLKPALASGETGEEGSEVENG